MAESRSNSNYDGLLSIQGEEPSVSTMAMSLLPKKPAPQSAAITTTINQRGLSGPHKQAQTSLKNRNNSRKKSSNIQEISPKIHRRNSNLATAYFKLQPRIYIILCIASGICIAYCIFWLKLIPTFLFAVFVLSLLLFWSTLPLSRIKFQRSNQGRLKDGMKLFLSIYFIGFLMLGFAIGMRFFGFAKLDLLSEFSVKAFYSFGCLIEGYFLFMLLVWRWVWRVVRSLQYGVVLG